MDTTETYIKMCDCEDIQKHKPNGSIQDYFYCYVHGLGCDVKSSIWLPTQDELQEMVADTIDCPSHSSCAILINVGHRIRQWCDKAWDDWMQFSSMEQLWLAFVMKELHGKVWVKEKWEKG